MLSYAELLELARDMRHCMQTLTICAKAELNAHGNAIKRAEELTSKFDRECGGARVEPTTKG